MPKKYSTTTTLVIVESPAKCKKIEEYLGPGYKCVASYGHLRTITSLKNIDIENINLIMEKTGIVNKDKIIEIFNLFQKDLVDTILFLKYNLIFAVQLSFYDQNWQPLNILDPASMTAVLTFKPLKDDIRLG